MLDLTPPTSIEQDPKCDRTVALYGYLRGTNFPSHNARVHVPGIGDLEVSQIEGLPDPCPTPQFEQAQEKAGIIKKRKRLDQKQKVIYAPMSDVGGVLMDKDAVYIDVKSNNFDVGSDDEGERGFGEQMMVGLQGGRKLLGEDDQGISLFGKGQRIQNLDDDDEGEVQDTGRKGRRTARFAEGQDGEAGDSDEAGFDSADSDDEADLERLQKSSGKMESARKSKESKDKEVEGDIAFADSDSDLGSISSVSDQELEDGESEEDEEEYSDDDDDGETRWKSRLAERAQARHSRKQPYRVAELARLMYDDMLSAVQVVRKWRGEETDKTDGADEEEAEDELFERKVQGQSDEEDRMVPAFDDEALENKWSNEENIDALKKRFAARTPTGVNAEGLGEFEGFDGDGEGDEDDEGDGEFEDLEAGDGAGDDDGAKEAEDLETEREKNARRKEELKLRFEEEDREGFLNPKNANRDANGENEEREFGEDDWYDAQKALLQKQQDINRREFEQLDESSRVRAEGYKAGTYARLVLHNVPSEFIENYNPRYPLLVGGLQPTEERMGFVQVRIKRHRWHKKILKTNDPLIISLGWRRFQTTPVYSIHENRMRHRMLKYTPEHMHCTGTFYGPLAAPNTGFCAVQSFSNKNPGFRLAATGVVLNVDEGTEILLTSLVE
jgi:ribosome biogenesis protein BMS1